MKISSNSNILDVCRKHLGNQSINWIWKKIFGISFMRVISGKFWSSKQRNSKFKDGFWHSKKCFYDLKNFQDSHFSKNISSKINFLQGCSGPKQWFHWVYGLEMGSGNRHLVFSYQFLSAVLHFCIIAILAMIFEVSLPNKPMG